MACQLILCYSACTSCAGEFSDRCATPFYPVDSLDQQVSVARPSSKDIKNSKLYVTNLPDHFSQDQVVEVFQQVCVCVCFLPITAQTWCFFIIMKFAGDFQQI